MYTDSTYLLKEVAKLPAHTVITKRIFDAIVRRAKFRKEKHKLILVTA